VKLIKPVKMPKEEIERGLRKGGKKKNTKEEPRDGKRQKKIIKAGN
jgi:hypothetical protein